MSDEVERLNRLLDDLAAERAPADRQALTPEEASMAETAALLKAAAPGSTEPDAGFVSRLGERLSALHTTAATPSTAPMAPQAPLAAPAASAPTKQSDARGLSRRGLIGRAAAAAAGLAAGTGAGEVLRGHQDSVAAASAYQHGRQEGYRQAVSGPYSVPLAPSDRGSWMETGHTVHSLAPGRAVRFRLGAIEGFLVNPGHDQPIYALSATCTHMGCLLSWLDSTATFLCPCHGAQYQADGAVLSGIARHPLPRLQVRVGDWGELEVWSVDVDPAVTTTLPYQEP